MQKVLLITVAAGLAIGFLWPSASEPSPAPGAAARISGGEAPRETVLERSPAGHFYADVEVNGELVRFMVDTGATGIALTEETAQRIGLPFSPQSYTELGMGAGGPIRGQNLMLDTVSLDGKMVRGLQGMVLEGGRMNLLGQVFLGQFSVEMRGGTMRIS